MEGRKTMRLLLRFAAALALCAALLWAPTAAVLAQDGDQPVAEEAPARQVDRSSPRAVFDSFFRGYNDATKREGGPERMRDALSCLDLSFVAEQRRQAEGRGLANALKDVLDFHGFVELHSLPDEREAEELVDWALFTAQGPVRVVRTDDGWIFDQATLQRLDEMLQGFMASGAVKYQRFSLRTHVPPSLSGRFLLYEYWQWLGLACLFLIAWIIQRGLIGITGTGVSVINRRRQFLKDGSSAVAACRPVGLLGAAAVIVMGAPLLELPRRPIALEEWLVVAGQFLACIGAVMIAYRLVDVISARMAQRAAKSESRLDDQLVPLVQRVLKLVIAVGGALFVLDNMNVSITSLLAGFGLVSLGVGLAAKDTIANFFGSITVFVDQPFQVGDWVVVGNIEGTVEDVGFRSTRVRTFYNSLVSLPNAKLVDTAVDNMGRRHFRRMKVTLGVQYDTSPDAIEAFTEGMRQIVLANPWMRHDVYEIHLNNFGPSSLDILVYVFFKVPNWSEELRQRQNFMLQVIRLANELGVEFAFPTQTLHHASTPEHPFQAGAGRSIDDLDEVLTSFGEGGARSLGGRGGPLMQRREAPPEEPGA